MTNETNSERNVSDGTDRSTSRRTFIKAASTGAMVGVFGSTGASGQTASGQDRSAIGIGDGFADPSWLDDSARVITVAEATRSAVEEAFHASGPRVVVFETSGTIDLGGETLQITEDNCWVAGQTAPSPGITFINGMVQVAASNCVVQHIRSRIGPGSDGNIQGNDSINTADQTTNNVIDHCTASWGTDECMSVGYDTDRTTYSNNMIYEGLYDPYGNGADHNYCTLVGDGADHVALLGNVWAKARSRIPRLKGETRSVVANNLCYFFDEASKIEGSAAASFVGNKYTGVTATGESIVEGSGTVYGADNTTADPPLDSDVSFVEGSTASSRPLWPAGFDPMQVGAVEQHNLANAGARPADRTANDQRIVREIRERAGNDRLDSEYDYWIADPSDVGGYPQLPENTHSLNPPSSGLRQWLRKWAAKVEGTNPPTNQTPTPNDSRDTPPSPPSNLTVTETTSSSITLEWGPASDAGNDLDHYFVGYSRNPPGEVDTPAFKSTTVPVGTTSVTIDGLAADSEYEVWVRAVDSADVKSGNVETTARTDAAESPPVTGTTSHFDLDDGFASTDWFDDSVQVIRVQEPTVEAVRDAFTTEGPRLIVFETSGVIDLQGEDLSITYPNCWVAGQTAPSPGITFINGMVQVEPNNCVVQHIRVLRGDAGSGEGMDPLNNRDGSENVVFDHCTAMWGRDENLSVGYDSDRTTLANCLIAEGLEDPEENSNGSLIGDGASNVALLGTVYAKNNDRNPRIKDNAEAVVVNNLTYYFDKAIWMSSGSRASIVGNSYLGRFDWSDAIVKGDGSAYFEDNHVADPSLNGRPFQTVGTTLESKPLWPDGLEAMPSGEVENHNLAYAGARPADRIDHEKRIVDEIRNRTLDTDVADSQDSGIPNSDDAVGGYPDYDASTRSLDVPDSGLRQWLEQRAVAVEASDATPPTEEPKNGDEQTISVDVAVDTVSPDGTAEASITLSQAPQGLSGYEVDVSVADPSVATITDAAVPSAFDLSDTQITDDGSSISLRGSDAQNNITAGSEPVELATVTLSAQSAGQTDIGVTVDAMDADGGSVIPTTTTAGSLTVVTLSEIEGAVPRDVDGDGLHEDLNANGRVDADDIVVYFQHKNDDAITDHVDAYDYNGNGRIDYDDIASLFDQL